MPRRSVLVNGLVAVIVVSIGACQSPIATTVKPPLGVRPTPSVVSLLKPTISPPVPSATVDASMTLSQTEALRRIAELMDDNGGCHLPCWWGITPGQTSIESAIAILSPFASQIKATVPQAHESAYLVTYPDPTSPDTKYGTLLFGDATGAVETIVALSFDSLSQLLGSLGPPDEVWVHSGGISMGGLPPSFSLSLLYLDEGIMIYYLEQAGDYLNQDGKEYVEFCPEHAAQGGHPHLYLWSPERSISFGDTLPDINRSSRTPRYERIEDVSNMDSRSFYTAFANPTSSECLKTAAGIWP